MIRACINFLIYLCWWSIIGLLYCSLKAGDEEFFEDDLLDESLRNTDILIEED
jgi:hypothetical protein